MGLSLVGRQQLAPPQQLLLITGFCGGFSTFSTFSAELLLMLQEGQPFLAFLYLATSVLVGVLSIFAVVYFTGGPTIS
ncbi:CrcB-like protein involved in camphor resistance [Neolewinella xylanilytica]|uniref:Fluoride-specific ion channel n=2 Tax=Neolewinella xylanilytica TaxID=1514080 RepID=A0A2S6I2Y2_9BACT|nr:CrcB-like protein involved in camphor resistance [Neolewinella xylanilytica]